MANERLRPFRDYDEHDVLNLFAFGDAAVSLGVTDVVYAGSVVKIKTGWSNSDETQDMMGNVGAGYNNTVSTRWGVTADVEYCNGSSATEVPLGITLYDVREYDENQEALKFNPRKTDELQAVLTGQAVPIATKGTFLFATGAFVSTALVTAGASIYTSGDGQLTISAGAPANPKIGKALGGPDTEGAVLVKLEL
jgi:hypothetical protein